MNNRISMNSKSLQAAFPEVYGDFFSKNPIVVSALRHFCWTGSYTSWFGGVSVAQKLPLRTYIGLEPNNSGKIKLLGGMEFDDLNNKFKSAEIPLFQQKEIVKFIKYYLDKLSIKNTGLNIHFLTEMPLSGPGIYGAFSVSLATALLLYLKQITIKETEKYTNYNDISDKKLDDLLRLAWKLESLGYYQPSLSSLGVCTTFFNSQLPIINWSEPIDVNWGSVQNIEKFDNLIDKRRFLFVKLEKLLSKPFIEWSIDFALISCNSPRQPSSGMRGIYNLFNRNLNNYQTIANKLFSNNSSRKSFDFAQTNLEKIIKNNNYLDFAKILSINMIAYLKSLFENDSFEENGTLLFDSINKEYDGFSLGEFLYPELEKIRNIFSYKLIDKPFKVGLSMSGAGQRSELLIVGSCKVFTNFVDKTIEQINQECDHNIILNYASWLDGVEEDGVKIEQHLAEGVRSKFISQGSVSLKKYNLDNSSSELSSLEKLEKEKKNIDLLIDIAEERIYVKGEKLISKQLHSSSATIEVLRILLENLGKNVASSNLPESAYNHDRNEMQSKIISPLKKIIKSRTNKELPLNIIGHLVDFYLKLESSELDIRVIEKVF